VIGLFHVFERSIDGLRLRLALMPSEIGDELLLGKIRVLKIFLPGTKSQPAHVAIGNAGSGSHETNNLEVTLTHS
jgi:hypothetical protein